MAVDGTQSRVQVWTIGLIAGMHFIRLISLQTFVLILIFTFNRTFTIIDIIPVLIFIPIVILDFLVGFYIVRGKTPAIFLSTIYATYISFPRILRLILPFSFDIMSIVFYSSFVELLLVMFMGILWLNREWVRDSAE